jgi:hypothetical protein
MSREMWNRHYARRLAEARKNWPTKSVHTRETWAELMADQDCTDDLALLAAFGAGVAKDRELT